MSLNRRRLQLRGIVQGVGFRPYVYRLATELGLSGWVANSSQGVEVEVEGRRELVESFEKRLVVEKPPLAAIRECRSQSLEPLGDTGFTVKPSRVSGPKTALALPDLATCPDCRREIFDPHNRRYRYPFTACTYCGPRFSIIKAMPSDAAPLADLVLALVDAGIEIHCLRDLTRGGLVSALVEIAECAQVHIHLDEQALPINPQVRGACELLGLDPLSVACEGRFVALVPADQASQVLDLMWTHPLGRQAVLIGQVSDADTGFLTLRTSIGTTRRLYRASGDQLPRIC